MFCNIINLLKILKRKKKKIWLYLRFDCSPAISSRFPVPSGNTKNTTYRLIIEKIGFGRIPGSAGLSGYMARKSRISGNIRRGMPDNLAGYPASGKKSDPAQPYWILSGVISEFMPERTRGPFFHICVGSILAIAVYSFYLFSPLGKKFSFLS